MGKGKIVALEDRIPKLKEQRRRKANRRLIILLFLFFTMIAIVAYVQSPLSHVRKIAVNGNEMLTKNEIITLTKLTKKTNIWNVKKNDIASNLRSMSIIKDASVKMKWPNTIIIDIQERKTKAYLEADKSFIPVLDNGKILKDRGSVEIPVNAPILFKFKEGAILKEMLKALDELPAEILNSISEIHYTPKKTDEYHISLFMNDGFEVSATLRSFSDKMVHYPSIISQLDPDKKGIIDLEVGSYFKAYETEVEESEVENDKGEGKHVVLSLVCLVLGYMIAFSYHFTQKEIEKEHTNLSDKQWERTIDLRNQLIEQEEKNRKLQKELHQKQEKVLENEKELSKEALSLSNLAEEAEKYRMFLGKVKVKGQGVTVTLTDGAYDPHEENINNYLVHEFHVFKVINELYISGAAAIAINGQRLTSSSYIVCNGPVITVDGIQHPAPFEITAIGDADVLSSALNLTGGVKDQLVNDNIVFTLEKKSEIILNPIFGNS